ncbi:hypothetical protein Patl1_27382 [Pistacia atlantica]|uniref:Uncharacterized protein n=1 Tax=Pistacia atlantica TaxID=434234 RepID=A0ACC1BCF5_9ROSI|nr:hypothetical protein Patl1_27382 [Pistacia atlantica]
MAGLKSAKMLGPDPLRLLASDGNKNIHEHCYFLLCWDYLDASLLAMTEECAMIWLNLVENYVFVAVSLGKILLCYLS